MADPRRIVKASTPPTAIINNATTTEGVLPNPTSVQLLPGNRSVAIEYTAVDLVDPSGLRFEYRLGNKETRWSDAANRRFVQYADMLPGEYQFEVRARNSDGAVTWSPASLSVVVPHLFYETTWFFLLVAVGGLSVLIAGYELRQKRARARQRILQEEVDLRTRAEDELQNASQRGGTAILSPKHTFSAVASGSVG